MVDTYHGTKVADPYRWLEDLDADRTQAWVEAQNKVTFDYLANCLPRARQHGVNVLTVDTDGEVDIDVPGPLWLPPFEDSTVTRWVNEVIKE